MSTTRQPPASTSISVEDHLGLVHYVARQVGRGMRSDLDLDDLVSAGMLGLIGAAESFEPDRGLAFSSYAAPRIRGAILDELRKMDHATRGQRRKAREIAAARNSLAAEGLNTSSRDVAGRLGVDVETLWRWEADVEQAVYVPIDQPVHRDDPASVTPLELLSTESLPSPEDELDLESRAEALREALLELPERERTVLALSYYEGLKLAQIAEVLRVTESRVCQIRTKALHALRRRLAAYSVAA